MGGSLGGYASSLAVALFAASCAHQGEPPRVAPAIPTFTIEPPAPPMVQTEVPLDVPALPPLVRPAWRLDPETGPEGAVVSGPSGRARVVARNDDTALVRSGFGVFAVDARHGVRGPLKTPARTSWIGLQADAVVAAQHGGDLLVASGVGRALRSEAFVQAGRVPGAAVWDATRGLIVAGAGPEVHVSRDGGKTFRMSSPKPDSLVTAVAVREDGVLAASLADGADNRTVWVSRNHGRTWANAGVQAWGLARIGGWLYAGRPGCPIVLSADGLGWRDDLSGYELIRRDWEASVFPTRPSLSLRPEQPQLSSTDPAPPPPLGSLVAAGARECDSEDARPLPPEATPEAACLEGPLGCIGAADWPPPPTGRSRIEFFQDARCRAGDAEPYDWRECVPGATLVRPPTPALVQPDKGEVRAITLPAGCEADPEVGMIPAGGATLLLCAGQGRRALYLGDGNGTWHSEGSLAIAPGLGRPGVAMAQDGTMVLKGACRADRPCSGHDRIVRMPRALGDDGAWSELAGEVPLGVRVLGAGWMLAVVASSPDDETFTLELRRPGHPPQELMRGIRAGGVLKDLRIEGSHVVAERTRLRSKERVVLASNGELEAR